MMPSLPDTPTLKHIFSILQQRVDPAKVDYLTDWIILYTVNGALKQQVDSMSSPANTTIMFNTISKLFLEEIQSVCKVASPDQNSMPLTRYLTSGRGLLLLLALYQSSGIQPDFSGDLSALLLSLATFLKPDQDEVPTSQDFKKFLPSVFEPQMISLPMSVSGISKQKSSRLGSRSVKICKRRASKPACLPGFPEVVIPSSGQVGENLTQWEGSPSSEGEGEAVSLNMARDNLVKYIPVNYFAYFDNANLDSDEVTGDFATTIPRPPPLSGPPPLSTPRDVAMVALDLVCKLTRDTGQPLPPQQQATIIQLAMVASSQIKSTMPPLPLSMLICILLNCLTSLRFRPDLLHYPPLQSVLGTLLPVISKPQDLPTQAGWAQAAIQSLLLWRHFATVSQEPTVDQDQQGHTVQVQQGAELIGQVGLGQLVSSVVEGLEETTKYNVDDARVCSVSCCKVVQCVVQVLSDLTDQDTTLYSVNKLLDISIKTTFREQQVKIYESLTGLFTTYCYPADQLILLTKKTNILSSNPNYSLYLTMIEQAMENLAEVDQEHMIWNDPSPIVNLTDRDSALASSEVDSACEDIDKLKIGSNVEVQEFEPYLNVLIEKTEMEVELTLHHLDRLVTRGSAETRHRIALQIVLPYLAWSLGESRIEKNVFHVEDIMEILCKLVTQQPTAMALIRNQKVWRHVKNNASAEGALSRVAQQVIKTIVLNSHKFIKIRLSEAEAMALQDDENDMINFDQRDRNAQFWLFKQLYHVLVQSSIRVLNGDWPDSFSHLVSAWQVSLHLFRKVPDFLVFALERGIVGLNQQMLNMICKQQHEIVDLANLIGILVSFLIHLVVFRSSWVLQSPTLEVGELEEYVIKNIFPKLEEMSGTMKFRKIILAKVLEGSVSVQEEQFNKEELDDGITDDGYEADNSDDEESVSSVRLVGNVRDRQAIVLFKPGLKFYTSGLLGLLIDTGQDIQERLYTLEYLVFKLVRLKLVDNGSLAILNSGFISTLIEKMFLLSTNIEEDRIIGLATLVMELVSNVSAVHITPETIKSIYMFLANPNTLKKMMFRSWCYIILARVSDYNLPGLSIHSQRRRTRLSSNLSSDSGLDSNCSVSSSNLSLSNSRKYYVKQTGEDLERDYTIVMRIKIEKLASRNDEWVELVTVENRNESLGILINLEKGLKLTLSNWKGTFAAAETTFQTMFEPGRWIHLVFNVGTVTEGSRNTKTLSAFIDCCRVWDVGLSVDRRVNNKAKKEKFLCLTVGSGSASQQPTRQGPDVKVSDIYFLGNCCFTLQDIVMDYLMDSKTLTQPLLIPERVNLKRLGDKIIDLHSYCLPLISGDAFTGLALLSSRLVAHFSASGMWNSRTFSSHDGNTAWTLLRGVHAVGGLECLLLLPAAAIQAGYDDHLVSLCFDSALRSVTVDQEVFTEFQRLGGFSLFSNILTIENYSPGPVVIQTFLNNSSHLAHLGPEGDLLKNKDASIIFPELITLLLSITSITNTSIQKIVAVVKHYINEENPSANYNLEFLLSSKVIYSLLDCMVNMSKDGKTLPMDDFQELLSMIPATPAFLKSILNSSLLLCPPLHLYLSCPSPHLPGSPVNPPTSPPQPEYLESVHAQEVVDVISILKTESSTEVPSNKVCETRSNFDLECLETEEDAVAEWEVVMAVESNPAETSQPKLHASGCSTPLLSSLVSCLLQGFNLLSDCDCTGLVTPSSLLPLVSHTSPDIHSPALCLLGLVMKRELPHISQQFQSESGPQLLSGLLQSHQASQQLIESVLSLIHGHPVNIEIPFEFQANTPPTLNLTMSCLILPILYSSKSEVSLCHNLLTHTHELAANIPSFLSALVREGLPQTLLSLLIALGDNPGESSDMCGIFESDLLLDDIHNILRLLVVCYIEQSQAQFEIILDLVFMCAGLVQQGVVGEVAGNNVRVTSCLLVEESLYTLQKAISSYNIFKPSHYLDTEDFVDKSSEHHKFEEVKTGNQMASQTTLLARFNQLCKFGVNLLTSQERRGDWSLLPEEVGLANSLYSMMIDLECGVSKKKAGDPLVKGLKDGSSLAGVLLITLLQSSMSRRKKTELVRRLDALPHFLLVLNKLFPTSFQREAFRLNLMSLVSQTVLMDPVDSQLITSFYGKILNVSLFPEGPGQMEIDGQVRHKTYGPWEAERSRCRSVMIDTRDKMATRMVDVSRRFTEQVVSTHDLLSKESLENVRRQMCKSHEAGEAWRRIVENQTHPLGVWHCKIYEPRSLVLENVTGTSGIFTRLRKGHAGLYKRRYFIEGYEHLAEELDRHFTDLVKTTIVGDISLPDRLGGLDQVECVEPVKQVTATDKVDGELVVSSNKVFFVGTMKNWSASFNSLEAVCKRRYQLQDIALEFFLCSGEAHLVVFSDVSTRSHIISMLTKANVPTQVKSANLPVTTKLWRQGHLTNFQYLMELNRLSGRTLNDLMQYPVFPWVLADYTSPHLNLTIPDTFRSLRKPIAVQKDGSCSKYVQNYNILAADGSGLGGLMGPYHYASHYSNTGIVLHFLVRLPPFTEEFIKFQDGNFDLPDRSFHKLATSWLMASEVSASDVKELIPQLFYLPELFVNKEGFNLGRRQNGDVVSDVEMPEWAKDPRTFVKIHRQALESPMVRQELSHWIDLVFGYKQTGQEAVDAVNVFHPATYPTNQTQEMDELEARARQTMIETYGQTPLQLFTSAHPLPLAELVRQERGNSPPPLPVVSTVTGMVWGSYVGAPGHPGPTVVWQQNQGITVTNLVRLETNEVFGIPSRSLLVGKYNMAHCLGQINTGLQFMCGQLITWGHSDMALHCHGGKMVEEKQLSGSIFSWDQPVCGSSHPRAPAIWLGHLSGVVSVHPLTHTKHGPHLAHPTYLHGHTAQVSNIVLCPEYSVAVTASEDGSIASWDLHSLQLLHHVALQRPNAVYFPLRLAVSAKSGDVAVSSGDIVTLFTINLYKVADCSIGEKVTAIAFSNQEEGVSTNCVALGLQSGMVKLYSSLDLVHLRDIPGMPNSPVTALAYSEDSQNLAIATMDGVVTILEKSGNRGLNRTPKYVTLQ